MLCNIIYWAIVLVAIVGFILGIVAVAQLHDGFLESGTIENLKITGILDKSMLQDEIPQPWYMVGEGELPMAKNAIQARAIITENLKIEKTSIITALEETHILVDTDMTKYANREFRIYSKSDVAHRVILTAPNAYWDKYERYKIILFKPYKGSFVEFRFVEQDKVMVTDGDGISLCAADGETCDVFGDAPKHIVVGQPVEGIESFPVTPEPLARKNRDLMTRALERHRTRKEPLRSAGPHKEKLVRHLEHHTRLEGFPSPQIPVFPGILPGGTFPNPASVHVEHFYEAMSLLRNKVVSNTTILVHPGTYNENFILDGFSSRCVYSSRGADGPASRTQCQALFVIGDDRVIAGQSYVKGAFFNGNPYTPLLGSDNGAVDVVCSGANTITVTTTGLPFFSIFDQNPEFDALGVTDRDIITIYDRSTETFHERHVVSVSGNTVTFDGVGCPINGEGSSITFMPNRIIQSQGGILGLGPLSDQTNFPIGALMINRGAVVAGFWIKKPMAGEQIYGLVGINQHSYVTNIVADARTDGGVFTPTGTALWYHAPMSANVLPGAENVNEVFFTRSPVQTLFGGSFEMSSHATVFPGDLVIIDGGADRDAGIFIYYGSGVLYCANTVVVTRSGISHGVYLTDNSPFFAQSLAIWGGAKSSIFVREQSRFRDQFGATVLANAPIGVLTEGQALVQMGDFLDFYGRFENLGVAISANVSANVLVPNRPAVITNVTTFYQHSDSAYLAEGYYNDETGLYNFVERRPAMTYGANGPIHPDYRSQVLAGSGALSMSLPGPPYATIELYMHKEYAIYSTTAFAHVVTLSGGLTWDGTNTVATFGGAIGDGISFRVVSDTVIVVTHNANVVFSA